MALPQLQTHQWNVPFQVPKVACFLRLVPSFNLKDYGHLFKPGARPQPAVAICLPG